LLPTEIENPFVCYPAIPDETHGISYDGFVRDYYSWLLSESPRYHQFPLEPVFFHGTLLNNPIDIRANIQGQPIDHTESIATDTLVVIDVMGCFFFVGDLKDNGNIIRTREECKRQCLEEIPYEDGTYLTIKRIGRKIPDNEPEYPIKYKHIGPIRLDLEVDASNPYLDKFAGPPDAITPGPKIGYGASWLAIFRIKIPGEYVITSAGNGKPPYHTQGCYQLIVRNEISSSVLLNRAPTVLDLPGDIVPHD